MPAPQQMRMVSSGVHQQFLTQTMQTAIPGQLQISYIAPLHENAKCIPGLGCCGNMCCWVRDPPPARASIASVRLARWGRRDRGAIARAAPRAAAIAPAASKSSNEPRRGPVVIASQLCPTRRASSTRKPFFFLAPAPTSLPP
jgi:hypothetical protein